MSEWPVVKLGDVADTALGKMLDRGRPKGLPTVPYLRNVNVQWGRIDTDDLLEMELADQEHSRFGVEAGDLLVCEGGDIGRAAIWAGRSEYMAYQKALHRIRPTGSLDMRFLRYLLEHYQSNGTLQRFSTGIAIAHLPQQQLRAIPLALPPLAVQIRIVDLLEDHLSRLDAAAAYLDLVDRSRDHWRDSLLASLAPGKSVARALGDVVVDFGYGTSTKCVVDGPGVPVVRIPNLQAGRVDMRDEKRAADSSVDLSKLMLETGDVLIVRTNGSRDLIGRASVVQPEVRASFASYLIRFRVNPTLVRPDWVRVVFDSPNCRRVLEGLAASSAGQYNLGLKKLSGVEIPIPDVDVQDRLLSRFEERMLSYTGLHRAASDARLRNAALRKALLSAAFSGRLTGHASDTDRIEELADA